MWVIMTEDRQCVIKGKTRKHLVGIGEATRKELVAYQKQQDATSAIMRMMVFTTGYVDALYPDGKRPRLLPVELEE